MVDNLSLEQMTRKVTHYFQEMDEFLIESLLVKEKEFVINPLNPKHADWIKENPEDFTVIVRRIE